MRRIPLLLLFIAACAQMGCKDPVVRITETSEVNEWVYSVMKANYLWSDELPSKENSGLTTATQNYFDVNLRYRDNMSVAYTKDTFGDRFSKIAPTDGARSFGGETAAATEKDYDFGFYLVSVTYFGTNRIAFLQVLYVVPGSPADKAGLRRGDAFADNIGTEADVDALLSQQEITLTITNRDVPTTITIAKGSFYNNPVLFSKIIDVPGTAEKVGYLVYNHFTSGDPTGAANYSTKLKEVFKDFKSKGATKLILDLRYNGGGEVANAQLLASLIVPSTNLGKTWMYAERNTHKFDEYHFMSASELGGSNANIDELFVITSSRTASASELIIHTLRPYYGARLHVTGFTTVGKNLGSREFKKEGISWVMNPITMRVYNKEKESGYERGITPDDGVELEEFQCISAASFHYDIFPLGDIDREWLLNKVMSEHFGVPEAKYYVQPGRSGGHSFEATANVRERGLTETPQTMR